VVLALDTSTTDDVDFVRGSATVTIAAEESALVWTDGTTNGLVAIIGGSAGSGGSIQTLLDGISTTQGVLLYYNGTDWVALSPGTSGHILQTGGAGANPSWVAPPSSNIQTLLDGISTTQGTILYYNGTDWVALAPGTSGHVLKTQGAGANPQWAAETGGGGGGDAWQITWRPFDNEAPGTNWAALATRNQRPLLLFDTGTQEAAIFSGVLPFSYGGGGVTVYAYFSASSATSGTIGWDVAFERTDTSGLDIDSDSFATAQTITAATVPGTSGQVLRSSVNISNGADMDSLAAGELFRLRIRRDVANDTATGDAELLCVVMVEQ